MSKELNDALIRETELVKVLQYYRIANVPDGALTDERRHSIVMSLKQERDDLWQRIAGMCDREPVEET